MTTNAGIACRARAECPECGGAGTAEYAGLRDRLFGAPGQWGMRSCRNCDLLWLDLIPENHEVGKLYARYYTHSANAGAASGAEVRGLKRKILARAFGYPGGDGAGALKGALASVLSQMQAFRDYAGGAVMWLPHSPGKKLLDLGCGSGEFPLRMRGLGWTVAGAETDPAAAKFAREKYGIDVRAGDVFNAGFAEKSFDAITLSHVIEHVPDPRAAFAKIASLLTPGGLVSVVTPNQHSLAHRCFGSAWRGLEVPRHFQVFSSASLGRAAKAAGLRVRELRTVARTARKIWWESRRLARAARGGALDLGTFDEVPGGAEKLRGLLFQAAEEAGSRALGWGEEILLIAERAP